MSAAVVALIAVALLEAAGLVWLTWPDSYRGRHFAGCNPVRDEIDRALNASRRQLRRSLAPWSQPQKRHSDETP